LNVLNYIIYDIFKLLGTENSKSKVEFKIFKFIEV